MNSISHLIILIIAAATWSFTFELHHSGDTPVLSENRNPAVVWAELDPATHSIRILPGHAARFEGKGKLTFTDGRSLVQYPEEMKILVEGRAVNSKLQVLVGAEVVISDKKGETAWTIESAGSDLPEAPGTKISDTDRTATASLETRQQKIFFLKVDQEGQATYFEPDL